MFDNPRVLLCLGLAIGVFGAGAYLHAGTSDHRIAVAKTEVYHKMQNECRLDLWVAHATTEEAIAEEVNK